MSCKSVCASILHVSDAWTRRIVSSSSVYPLEIKQRNTGNYGFVGGWEGGSGGEKENEKIGEWEKKKKKKDTIVAQRIDIVSIYRLIVSSLDFLYQTLNFLKFSLLVVLAIYLFYHVSTEIWPTHAKNNFNRQQIQLFVNNPPITPPHTHTHTVRWQSPRPQGQILDPLLLTVDKI